MPEKNEIILESKMSTKSFGGLLAVNKVNLSVSKGELRALIGPNGAGKTTLLNLITGTLRALRRTDLFQRKGDHPSPFPSDLSSWDCQNHANHQPLFWFDRL